MATQTDKLVNAPILHKGMGAPYVALFNEVGKPIENSLTGLPLGAYINLFNYKTDEGNENLCTLEICTGNPLTVDNEEIQEGSTILIQWGYIFPDTSSTSSPPLSLKIRDVDILFSDQGTKITLKCIDKTGILRQMPIWIPEQNEQISLKAFMDEGFGQNMGVVIEKFEYEEE